MLEELRRRDINLVGRVFLVLGLLACYRIGEGFINRTMVWDFNLVLLLISFGLLRLDPKYYRPSIFVTKLWIILGLFGTVFALGTPLKVIDGVTLSPPLGALAVAQIVIFLFWAHGALDNPVSAQIFEEQKQSRDRQRDRGIE